ncbi:MAG: oligosaccharide flippase family protein [Candidatus Omnitrophota bacterium]|nr:oligosaccharide flippase family protein [Candidatus Omnitrophota bacterium]
MLSKIKRLDHFTKNIIFVFLGTSLANFFNLIYQLVIAHKLSPQDFAAFNALLAVFMLISNPLGILQVAVAKYASEYSARREAHKINALIQGLFSKGIITAFFIFIVFIFISPFIIKGLKIDSLASGYILAMLIAFSVLAPILAGGLQGLEFFGWLVASSLLGGIIKLIFTVLFIFLGFQIAGALGALLVSIIFQVVIGIIPLRKLLTVRVREEKPDYKEIFLYLFPIAISNMCFIWLICFDMVLVKYFFSPEASGAYSLAQMLGKVFLFLPAAISIVMFPRTSGLNAVNSETTSVLKKSLLYALYLCLSAALSYNIFPGFTLKLLTGKALPESILLGRLFSISMTFFALSFVLINYFLSIKNLSFIKYLVISVVLQFAGILIFHRSLIEVQSVLCVNSCLLFAFLYSRLKAKPNL